MTGGVCPRHAAAALTTSRMRWAIPCIGCWNGLRRRDKATGLHAPPGAGLEILAELAGEPAQIVLNRTFRAGCRLPLCVAAKGLSRLARPPMKNSSSGPRRGDPSSGRRPTANRAAQLINLSAAAWPQLARSPMRRTGAIEAEAPMMERPDSP